MTNRLAERKLKSLKKSMDSEWIRARQIQRLAASELEADRASNLIASVESVLSAISLCAEVPNQ